MPVNGEMLRLARQRGGFQQTDAAASLGVTQSVLSRYENGLSEPRDPFLEAAARLYGVLPTFFGQTDPVYGPPVSVHPMWRRKAGVSARDIDGIVAELNVRAIHTRRFLEAVDIDVTRPLPRLDIDEYEDASEVAALLRSHWGAPSGPLGNLCVLAERSGILVAHSHMGGAHVSGVTFAPSGLPPLVMLNSDQPSDRLRWTLAHEIGHLVMHRFPTPRMEEEANEFASALLLPAADLLPHLRGRRIDLTLLAALKPEWRVSMQAILMRAKGLGLVDRNREEYLWKQISARRWRLREPPELDFPAEIPTVVPGLYRVYRETLGLTLDETARVLHLAETGVTSLYGEDAPSPVGRPRLRLVG